MAQPRVEEIKKLAEKNWEACHHCDQNDKEFWINGFVHGYLLASHDQEDKTFKKKSLWTKVDNKQL